MKKRVYITFLVFAMAAFSLLGPNQAHGDISNHVLNIELSTTYGYGLPGDPLTYSFDACLQVDKTVASGTLEIPDGSIFPLELEKDGAEIWLSYFRESTTLNDLANLESGTYTFTVTYKNGSSESTAVDYALENGDPIPPVTQQPQITYPADNSTEIPTNLTVEFEQATDPAWTFDIAWQPQGEQSGLYGEAGPLPYNSNSSGPVTLSPETIYELDIAINHVRRFDNSAGIPVVMDMDAEGTVMFATATPTAAMALELVGKNLPTAVISGSNEKISLTALIENTGDGPFDKNIAVDIYLYAYETTTGVSTEIGSFPVKSISNLKPGKVKKHPINTQLPEGLADGVYELTVAIGDEVAAVENYTLTVQEGFVDLTMTADKVSLPSAIIPGESAKTAIQATVTNTGNITTPKTAMADFTVVARPTTGGDDIILDVISMKFGNLMPGKGKKFNLKPAIPSDVPEGTYDIFLQCNYGEMDIELDLNHPMVVSEPIIILSMTADKVSLPSAVIAGESVKTAIQATVTNTGNITTPKTAMADFTVIAYPTTGGDGTIVDVISMKFGNLMPGKGKIFSIKPAIPSDVPEGTYDIFLRCESGDISTELNLDHQMVVSGPFVDLTSDLGAIAGPDLLIPGSKANVKLPIEISNSGNVALDKTDTIDVQVYLRKEGGGQNDILIASSLNYKVGGLTNGKPKKLSMSISMIPATVASGDYRYVIIIDSGNDISESDETNNETLSNEVVSVLGGFLELTQFDSTSNKAYTSTVRGNLLGDDFTGALTVNVDTSNGYITETVTSNDGFDTQQQTYRWGQNSQGIYLGSFGQEIDMGSITFNFDNLTVFPADGHSGTKSNLTGMIEIDYGGIDIDLTGTASASGVTNGIKTIKVNGQSYDAVESKISLTIDSQGQVTGESETITLILSIKQDITYWATSNGIIKSQIKTTVKVKAPGAGSASGSGSEVREIIL